MRRLVVALFVVALALALAGCGGGGEDTATTPAPAPAPAPVAVKPADGGIADRSAQPTDTFEPFPATPGIPAGVQKALDTGQPMLLLFTNGSVTGADDLKGQVDKVVADNRGLIDLFTYDMSKYTSFDANGQVVVDEAKLTADTNAQEAVTLARALKVNFTPYIVIVDDQGQVIFRWRGFIDSAMLERQVGRVSED